MNNICRSMDVVSVQNYRAANSQQSWGSPQSPILQLPLETLSEIFVRAIPDKAHDVSDRAVVVNLSLVCRTWRQAAMATHSLWSGVVIHASHGNSAYEKAVDWLRRSGSLPKTLEIRQMKDEKADDYGSALAASRLLAEGPTFRLVSIDCKGLKFFLNLVTGIAMVAGANQAIPWNTMSSFELRLGDWRQENTVGDPEYPWSTVSHPSSVFQLFPPAISSLVLVLPPECDAFIDTDAPPHGGVLNIPTSILRQLTFLELECNWRGVHTLEVLEKCHNLKTLKLWTNGTLPLANLPPLQSRFCLANLERLELSNVCTLDHLRYIQTPNLRRLEILLVERDEMDFDADEGEEDGTEGDISPLLEFLSESGKLGEYEHLDYLEIATQGSIDIPPSELQKLLFSHLQVKHLVLSSIHGVPWDAIHSLVRNRTNALSNKALETFELLNVPISDEVEEEEEELPFERVCAFLRSRGGRRIRLKGSSDGIETPIMWNDSALSVSIVPS